MLGGTLAVMSSGEAWVDLAGNVAGRQVSQEANRRRRVEGAGADRSWRLGAEGEHRVGEALAELTTTSPWGRLRGHRPGWWVLHSVPVGTGSTDIDHVIGGPPGIFTVNAKHHRTRRVNIEADQVAVGRRDTAYVTKAVAEAERAQRLLADALLGQGQGELAARVVVRPVLAIVGARLLGRGLPGGVLVAQAGVLPMLLRELPAQLDAGEVAALFEVARRSTTWSRA